MSTFVSRSACKRHRPSHYASYSGFQRSALMARLLKERDVARFIVAPHGFGKTYLALDYGETMFSWAHVFWINAQSPCFIRDLDSKDIVAACIDADPEVALVVFDDLPALDVKRAEEFSKEIDVLLERGCEVVVTCVPSCDLQGSFQVDRQRICASELLLTDDELDDARSSDERMNVPSNSMPAACRVPELVWGHEGEKGKSFARRSFHEELPADFLYTMCTAYVLVEGSRSDMLALGAYDAGVAADFAADYPHLGLSEDDDAFQVPCIQMESLSTAVKDRMDDLLERSPFESPVELVFAWADTLLRNKQAERACAVVRTLCPRRDRARWLVANDIEIVRQAAFFPAVKLLGESLVLKDESKMRAIALEALCRRILGDESGALRAGKRCAFDSHAPWDARVCGALVTARLSTGALFEQTVALLGEFATMPPDGDGEPGMWSELAHARLLGETGPYELAEYWGTLVERGVQNEVLCVIASWLFSMMGRDEGEMGPGVVSLGVKQRQVERFVREMLLDPNGGGVDYFAASAGLALEEAHDRGVPYCEGPLEARIAFTLRRVEMSVLAQRGKFEQEVRNAQAKKANWVATRPDSYLGKNSAASVKQENRGIPTLTLKLFGKLEVSIGDDVLGPECFKRQNVRTLLVLLGVNAGKEIPRDRIARSMWPSSTMDVARKNFYAVWSELRRALTLSDGTCPYLLRHQYGCSIEQRHVKSDMERFSEICRDLLFGFPDVERWAELFGEIDRDFSSDLMPIERDNQLIVEARNECRSRLVDALVTATGGIVDAGHPQWGVWFARTALNHDETREDAYIALMRAQIAGNQRTAAMMTFLKCRRVLNDQLGVDPSPESQAIYDELINGTDSLGA